jgi:rhodanese-related sulfurtransferase
MQATGENIIVLDGRSPEEFARMSIPGGISVPNAELVYRIHDLAPDPATTVIVNCAGRTRSIIGAQALINAGVPNRVVALKGGTMGWRLAGLQLNHGRTDKFPPLSEAGRAKAVTYAADVRRRFNVPMAAPRTVETWLQNTSRTTYLLDVRSVEEFQAGHMPGARHAPGGQLVQGADQWCGVKGGRIILLDDAANVRATLTGHWLGQMGWDVHVLEGGIDAVATETRIPEIETPGLPNPRSVTPEVLASGLAAKQVAVAHVDLSSDYQAGHIPGAVWGIRSRMDALLDNLSGNGDQRPIVLYSEHETRARLAAVDLATLTDRPISILAGGREAWKKEGRPLETTTDRPTDAERIDFLFWVHDRHLGNDQAARDYLAWEEQLPGQIEADGDATFQIVR